MKLKNPCRSAIPCLHSFGQRGWQSHSSTQSCPAVPLQYLWGSFSNWKQSALGSYCKSPVGVCLLHRNCPCPSDSSSVTSQHVNSTCTHKLNGRKWSGEHGLKDGSVCGCVFQRGLQPLLLSESFKSRSCF